jgi:hypothetical protein
MSQNPVYVSLDAVHGVCISHTTPGMFAPVLSLNDLVYLDIVLNKCGLF